MSATEKALVVTKDIALLCIQYLAIVCRKCGNPDIKWLIGCDSIAAKIVKFAERFKRRFGVDKWHRLSNDDVVLLLAKLLDNFETDKSGDPSLIAINQQTRLRFRSRVEKKMETHANKNINNPAAADVVITENPDSNTKTEKTVAETLAGWRVAIQ